MERDFNNRPKYTACSSQDSFLCTVKINNTRPVLLTIKVLFTNIFPLSTTDTKYSLVPFKR